MQTIITHDEENETKASVEIARILQLKPARDSRTGKRFNPERYDTTHGTKTALGLYRTLAQFYVSEK